MDGEPEEVLASDRLGEEELREPSMPLEYVAAPTGRD
jgi:hypothetical protein